MESQRDRLYRTVFPPLMPRYFVIATLGVGAIWLHTRVRDSILVRIPGPDLRWLYVMITSIVLIVPVTLGVVGFVIGYFYHLRERRIHTAMTEAGLALRAIFVAMVGFAIFGFAIGLNFGW